VNNKLINVNEFVCPSETQQIGEQKRDRITQSAKIGKIGHGNSTVNMTQSPQVHYYLNGNVTDFREILKTWLSGLPEPRWNHAKIQIASVALEICGGNSMMAAQFLGRSRSITNYYLKAQKIPEVKDANP